MVKISPKMARKWTIKGQKLVDQKRFLFYAKNFVIFFCLYFLHIQPLKCCSKNGPTSFWILFKKTVFFNKKIF